MIPKNPTETNRQIEWLLSVSPKAVKMITSDVITLAAKSVAVRFGSRNFTAVVGPVSISSV
jgi:hypothetical protein